jgi:telomere length regulation protein
MNTDESDRIAASTVEFVVSQQSTEILERFLPKMKVHEQRKYFNAVLTLLANYLAPTATGSKTDAELGASKTVSGAARLIHNIIRENESLREHLIGVLTRSSIPVLDDSLDARRSLIAALAHDDGKYLGLHTVPN